MTSTTTSGAKSAKSFIQRPGSTDLDAPALLMPLMRFISPTDPRWLATLKAIEEELTVDTLVYRYKTESGAGWAAATEGAFTACSFWFIECSRAPENWIRRDSCLRRCWAMPTTSGLYSEELGRSGQHLGIIPQAFTHLALISAATYLDRALSGDLPPWR